MGNLQVAIPAFEGLLPLRDGETIMDMLFELANWHALAKLRLHTSITLDIWRTVTRYMYASVRKFARTTCERHVTRELPQETLARARRAKSARKSTKGPRVAPPRNAGPKIIKYNTWNTFKYHALGHQPSYVERSGTNDNFNSQVVSTTDLRVVTMLIETHRGSLNTDTPSAYMHERTSKSLKNKSPIISAGRHSFEGFVLTSTTPRLLLTPTDLANSSQSAQPSALPTDLANSSHGARARRHYLP